MLLRPRLRKRMWTAFTCSHLRTRTSANYSAVAAAEPAPPPEGCPAPPAPRCLTETEFRCPGACLAAYDQAEAARWQRAARRVAYPRHLGHGRAVCSNAFPPKKARSTSPAPRPAPRPRPCQGAPLPLLLPSPGPEGLSDAEFEAQALVLAAEAEADAAAAKAEARQRRRWQRAARCSRLSRHLGQASSLFECFSPKRRGRPAPPRPAQGQPQTCSAQPKTPAQDCGHARCPPRGGSGLLLPPDRARFRRRRQRWRCCLTPTPRCRARWRCVSRPRPAAGGGGGVVSRPRPAAGGGRGRGPRPQSGGAVARVPLQAPPPPPPPPARATASCAVCAVGTYSAPGSSRCATCPAGFFQSSIGQSSCSRCPLEPWAAGSSVCTPCASGTSPLAVPLPARLPAGMTSTAQAGSCTLAQPGLLGAGPQRRALCALPAHAADPQEPLQLCPAGMFQAGQGFGTCNRCPQGTFASFMGSSACAPCRPAPSASHARHGPRWHGQPLSCVPQALSSRLWLHLLQHCPAGTFSLPALSAARPALSARRARCLASRRARPARPTPSLRRWAP